MQSLIRPAVLALFMALAATPGFGQQETSWQQRAPHELEKLFAALASGNTETIERHLAAEFQIVRSNGATFDKANIRVLTFKLEVNETIEGHAVENLAPQLIVFRDLGERHLRARSL